MATLYLYPLLILLIAFAFRLDSYEAVYPPQGFKPACLLVVEAYWIGGLWRYDPDEEVIEGIPTMYKLNQERFSTTDKSIVYNESSIDSRLFLSWHKWAAAGYAIRFSKNRCRLDFNSTHPCEIDKGGQTLWRVMKDVWGGHQEGWALVTNEIVNVLCVPEKGGLSSQLQYDLRQYDGYKSVYLCAAWLKEIEVLSGVESKATAVAVDPALEKCTLHYEDHDDLIATNDGDIEYCFLRRTFTIPEFPGFYLGCAIYLEDPIFAGLWELDLTTEYNSMPYLRRRLATMDDPLSVQVTLHNGFDDASATLNNGQLQFRQGEASLDIPLLWHICIGPDTNYTHSIAASNSEHGTIYRYDIGLDCFPYYGFSESFSWDFNGFEFNYLDDHHSLLTCKQYMQAEFEFAQWKVIVSTVGLGPCWAFGGGLDYSQMGRFAAPNTYSCYSTKYYKTIRPASSCQYAVEAGMYSGLFEVDLFWFYVYSQYPAFSRRIIVGEDYDFTLPQLKWEDGYKLTGLDDEWLVDLGNDVNICPDVADSKTVPVRFNDAMIGIVYRFDTEDRCDPLNVYMSPNYDYSEFDVVSGVTSLKDCKDQAEALREGIRWKAFVRVGSDCKAYSESLNLSKFVATDSASDSDYTCINRLDPKPVSIGQLMCTHTPEFTMTG